MKNLRNLTMQSSLDIDEAINYIHSWDQYTDKMLEENKELKRQIFVLTKSCELTKNNESQVRQEIEQLHKILSTLQETLHSQHKIIDENEAKKLETKRCKEQIGSLERQILQQEKDMVDKINTINVFNDRGKDSLKKEFEDKLEKKRKEMQDSIDNKDKKLKELELRIFDLQKEKQTEIMKIRLECDTKLQKFHRQPASESQVNVGSSMVRNDILRRKMQHIQAEAEVEIHTLKEKISELEKSLEKQQLQKKRKLYFHSKDTKY